MSSSSAVGLCMSTGSARRAHVEARIVASCDDFMGRTEWDRAVLRMLRPTARYHEVGEVLGEPFYQDASGQGRQRGRRPCICTAGGSALKGDRDPP